ncbi:hypothetical protein E2C01_098417 [Portunus trituberculatus]|uniref:Uncharacterized protein n=1 Tax=Portunus trituberculatus TaxID=210409 RepID=A0A5B7JXS3_PORTR|nr:hypothetical protein [Portunus trituberculatus]
MHGVPILAGGCSSDASTPHAQHSEQRQCVRSVYPLYLLQAGWRGTERHGSGTRRSLQARQQEGRGRGRLRVTSRHSLQAFLGRLRYCHAASVSHVSCGASDSLLPVQVRRVWA